MLKRKEWLKTKALGVLMILLFIGTSFSICSANLPKWEINVIKHTAKRFNLSKEETIILMAIRRHENGGKGRQFGVLHPYRPKTYRSQCAWCADSIKRNRIRYENKYKEKVTLGNIEVFIRFMGRRYCPVGVKNDPKGLNKYWIPGVTSWFYKFKKLYWREVK